jgi:cytochrome P450
MLLEEPDHLKRRKLMLPPFHGERMKGYAEMMSTVTSRELVSWPVGEPFALWPRMQEITLESVMRIVFGEAETGRMRRLHEELRSLTDWMNDPRRLTLLAAAGPRWLAGNSGYKRVIGPVETTVLEEVQERRSVPDGAGSEDIASTLSHARYEDGSAMTEQDLRDELVTLLTDGPTSALLCWAFERLLRHPKKLAYLRAELLRGEGTYLDAVVKETMRLCPATPIVVRRLLAPMQLGAHRIPAGTTVAPCVHLVHRREDLYPQPLSFRPERFIGTPTRPYTWIPFGGGVRRCLAASYAQMLMREVIRTVVSNLDLAPVEARSEIARKSAITFVPNKHGMVRIIDRHRSRSAGPVGHTA